METMYKSCCSRFGSWHVVWRPFIHFHTIVTFGLAKKRFLFYTKFSV